jgi:DNA repair photolyase
MHSWKIDSPSKLDVAHLSSLFDKVFTRNIISSKAAQVIASRLPLRIGMNTDPFQRIEKYEHITYDILKLLKYYKYPYILLTKNRLVADDQYLSLYNQDISYLQITITTMNAEISSKMERGASTPQDRLEALQKLVGEKLRVAVRINPMFPIFPDGHYTDATKSNSLGLLNVFSWDLVERICEYKPSTVIAGFLRVESQKTHRWLENEAGINLRPYFWRHKSRKYFSREEIEVYYKKCKAICDAHNVPFTVCFDCNKNYEYFKYMWANPADCCNGLNKIACFTKTYSTLASEA